MLTSIAVRPPIKILHVKTDDELIYVVNKIIEKHTDGKAFERKVVKREAKTVSPQVAMLCQIPGIGRKNAEALLKITGNLRTLAVVEYDELLKVEGIGPKLAKNILEVFDSKVNT